MSQNIRTLILITGNRVMHCF